MELNGDVAWDSFDPVLYHQHNYGSLRADDRQIIELLRDFFGAVDLDGSPRGIDVGTGSNLFPALSMLPLCTEISLWEHSASNTTWLRSETSAYSPSWDGFWQVLAMNPRYRAVDDPRQALADRARVVHDSLFNLPSGCWDIGTMFFVAESISNAAHEFTAAVHNFLRSLTPGSPFFAAFMRNSSGYQLGEQSFPSVAIEAADVSDCLGEFVDGLVIDLVDIQPEPLRAGYSGMIVARGRTLMNPSLPGPRRSEPHRDPSHRPLWDVGLSLEHLAESESESESEPRFSHVSIELGHLDPEDMNRGPDHIKRKLRRAATWVRAGREAAVDTLARQDPARASTCFLVDDYSMRIRPPSVVIPRLLEAARESGVQIDYLVRESACADTADAEQTASMGRWIDNGQRRSLPGPPGLDGPGATIPGPSARGHGHSIFVDVELWSGEGQERILSCAYVAAIWQLVRLGVLDDPTADAMIPRAWDSDNYPDSWSLLPPVLRLRPDAAPFRAYRTMSILDIRYLPVEIAVRTVLDGLEIDEKSLAATVRSAAADGVDLPRRLADRAAYMFVDMR